MENLIRLTNQQGEHIYVNRSHITTVQPGNSPNVASFVATVNGKSIGVRETVAQVLEAIDPPDEFPDEPQIDSVGAY